MVVFRTLLGIVLVAVGVMGAPTAREGAPGPAAPDAEALRQWRAMRFGMFIHWGPVSLTGHEIGWSRGRETPIAVYDQLYKAFNPTLFRADEWVRVAKAAGMKYLIVTSKHHDGFCLWPSAFTDYDIGETPFARDVLEELSEACQKQGIRFGIYYSVCDWHHPDFPRGSPGGKTRKPHPDLERYNVYLRNQVTELLRNYGPLVTLWFDVPQEITKAQAETTMALVRGLQPDILINNRIGGGLRGDYDTPEQRVGGFNRARPWETCMTLCRQWAWKPNDSMKSLRQCVQTLLRTVGGDGNLLFNVGPMPDGRIEARQVTRLEEIGRWLRPHAARVYGTRGGPFKPGRWGASTCKGNTISLFVMNWPAKGPLLLPPVAAKILGASLPKGGTFTQTGEGIVIKVPETERDPIATVIDLKVEGEAEAIEPVAVPWTSDSLAFGKAATASNVFRGMTSKYGPAKAFDDDPTTRWATDAGTSACWLDVDLGAIRTIGKVLVDEHGWNRVRRFRLRIKAGRNDAWKTVLEGKRFGEEYRQRFPPVAARFVRLDILEASEGPTLWEFQLFSPAN